MVAPPGASVALGRRLRRSAASMARREPASSSQPALRAIGRGARGLIIEAIGRGREARGFRLARPASAAFGRRLRRSAASMARREPASSFQSPLRARVSTAGLRADATGQRGEALAFQARHRRVPDHGVRPVSSRLARVLRPSPRPSRGQGRTRAFQNARDASPRPMAFLPAAIFKTER